MKDTLNETSSNGAAELPQFNHILEHWSLHEVPLFVQILININS